MPQSQSRRLAAILAADIAGYSALMGADEARTVRDLKGHQAVVLPLVGEFGGRIIDTAGDGILAEFPSVVNAVKCAVAIQSKMAERNAAIESERRMQFRVGINIGDVGASARPDRRPDVRVGNDKQRRPTDPWIWRFH
jgi:class 3 adenylate cyclase